MRYDRNIYPKKVCKNILYEGLTKNKDWPNLNNSFNIKIQKEFRPIYEADQYLYNRRRNIQLNKIHPIVEEKYNLIDQLPHMDFNLLREKCKSAKSSDEIEEIEFTYFFYTLAYELIYKWAAYGLIGEEPDQAFLNLTGALFGSIYFNSQNSLIEHFVKAASLFY